MAKNEELKKENIQRIRACFYQGGSWTKNTLAKQTDLSLAGTTNVLQDLLDQKEILYEGDAASTGGRKSKEYILNPDFSHIGSIYCRRKGNTYCYLVQIIDLQHRTVQEYTVNSKDGSEKAFEKALSLAAKDAKVKMITVSIPGVCANGRVTACDFEHLSNVDLGKVIQKKSGLPYVIENDVNTACISYASHEKDLHDIALIYQPENEYIGCGIMIRGMLYNGQHHEAGEMKNLGVKSNDAKKELQKAVLSLQAVLDPQRIVWCSDLVKKMDSSFHNLIHLDNLDEEIQNGLYQIAMHQLLKMRKEEE